MCIWHTQKHCSLLRIQKDLVSSCFSHSPFYNDITVLYIWRAKPFPLLRLAYCFASGKIVHWLHMLDDVCYIISGGSRVILLGGPGWGQLFCQRGTFNPGQNNSKIYIFCSVYEVIVDKNKHSLLQPFFIWLNEQ